MTKLLTVKDVAEQLDVHPQTIRKAIASGELQAYKLANKHQMKQAWVDKWLAKQKVQVGKQ